MAKQTDTWIDTTGNWATAADWMLGATPGSETPLADALISGGTSAFTVTVSDTEAAANVTLEGADDTLLISAGGTLLEGDATTPAPQFSLLSSATLSLGGTLGAAPGFGPLTISGDGTGALAVAGGTLSDVALGGMVTLATGAAVLSSVSGFSQSGVLSLGGNTLDLIAEQAVISGSTLSSGTISVGAGASLVFSGVNTDGQVTVTGGGSVAVAAGGSLTDPTATTLSIGTALQNNGTIQVNGYGTLSIGGAITGTGSILDQLDGAVVETIELSGTVAATQTINLTSGGATLILAAVSPTAPNAVAATIMGLATSGNDIQLPNLPYDSGLSGAVQNGVLTVTDGGTVVAQFDTPDLANGRTVSVLNDENGTEVIACYCAGTRIRTAAGDMAVEAVAVGDLLLTASGALAPVRWVGTRSYGARFLRGRPALLPVRFAAGSLGGGLPQRDLLVSPDHAMFVDGVLIPARHLVNGATIRREAGLGEVRYFHLELDRHDVILAEGAPSESFVDDGSRGVFHNAASYAGPSRPAEYCAPRVEAGPELEAIRRRLASEAAAA